MELKFNTYYNIYCPDTNDTLLGKYLGIKGRFSKALVFQRVNSNNTFGIEINSIKTHNILFKEANQEVIDILYGNTKPATTT